MRTICIELDEKQMLENNCVVELFSCSSEHTQMEQDRTNQITECLHTAGIQT